MPKRKITIACWLAIIGVVTFGAYYIYRFLDAMIPLNFHGDEGWQVLWFIEENIFAPFGARLVHFLMWMPTVFVTIGMLACALNVFRLVLRGRYFDPKTINSVKWVGILASLSGIFNFIASAVEAWWLTQFNPERAEIHFRIDSGEMGVLLIGIGVFLLAWVLQVAHLLDHENKGMV